MQITADTPSALGPRSAPALCFVFFCSGCHCHCCHCHCSALEPTPTPDAPCFCLVLKCVRRLKTEQHHPCTTTISEHHGHLCCNLEALKQTEPTPGVVLRPAEIDALQHATWIRIAGVPKNRARPLVECLGSFYPAVGMDRESERGARLLFGIRSS
jgi:hypothetical protein